MKYPRKCHNQKQLNSVSQLERTTRNDAAQKALNRMSATKRVPGHATKPKQQLQRTQGYSKYHNQKHVHDVLDLQMTLGEQSCVKTTCSKGSCKCFSKKGPKGTATTRN